MTDKRNRVNPYPPTTAAFLAGKAITVRNVPRPRNRKGSGECFVGFEEGVQAMINNMDTVPASVSRDPKGDGQGFDPVGVTTMILTAEADGRKFRPIF